MQSFRQTLKNLFAAQVLTAEQQSTLNRTRLRVLNWLTAATFLFSIFVVGLRILASGLEASYAFVFLAVLLAGVAFVHGMPYWLRASIYLALLYFLGSYYLVFTGSGGSARLAFLGVVVLGVILFDLKALLVTVPLTSLAWGIALVAYTQMGAEARTPTNDAAVLEWLINGGLLVLFIIGLGLPYLFLRETQRTAVVSASEKSALQEAQVALYRQKEQIESASRELAAANERLQAQSRTAERRASLLGVSAEVARVTATLRDLPELLQTTTQLISDRFGYYHCGIFLIDSSGEWAVMRAANSEGGQRMVARSHRRRVGQEGMVGYVTSTGKARIAQDTGGESIHAPSVDLPDTRSELTVPIKVRGEIIGALDVQSTDTNAFTDEDAKVLQTLADQVGIAIDNAHLFRETERQLQELRELQNAARQISVGTGLQAYHYDGLEIKSLTTSAPSQRANDTLLIPLRLGDQNLGEIEIRRAGEAWADESQTLAQSIADRMALALENAQLFDQTRARAQQLTNLSQAALELTGPQADLDQLKNQIVQRAAELFSADAAGLWLPLNAEEIQLQVIYPTGNTRLQGHILKRGQDMAGKVFFNGQPLRVDAYPWWSDAKPQFYAALPIKTAMALPMSWQGRAIGVLTLMRFEVGRVFTENDEQIAQLFAAQAASTLENARLFGETQNRMAETARLYNASRSIASARTLDDILQALVTHAAQKDFARFVLNGIELDNANQIVAMQRLAGWTIEEGYQVGLGQRYSVDDLPILRLFNPGNPMTVSSREAPEVDTQSRKLFQTQKIEGMAGIPLVSGGQIIGLLIVGTREPHLFTNDEIRPLQALADQAATVMSNLRLLDETQQQLAELAAINSISQILSSQLEIGGLLSQVGEQILKTFDFSSGYIALYNRETNYISFPYFVEAGEPLEVPPMQASRGLTYHVLHTKAPLLINRDMERRSAELGAISTGLSAKSWLGVPILVGDDAIGVISVQDIKRENMFTERDLRVLTTVAASVGVATQNARLFQQTQMRVAELATINTLSQRLATQLDLQGLVDLVGEQIRQIFNMPTAYVALYDKATQTITFPYWVEGSQRRDISPLKLGEGITSRVIQTREPVVITQNATALTTELGGVPTDDEPVQSYMAVPLTVGDEAVGALSVQTGERAGAFAESDVRLLSTIAANVSVAVQNARLFAQTQQRIADLATINNLSQLLTTQHDVDSLIDLVGRQVTQIFKQDALVALYDPRAQLISVPYFIGDNGERSEILPFPLGQGYSSYVIKHKKALRLGNEADRLALDFAPITSGAVALSWLGVPVMAGEEVLGLIAVQSSQQNNLFTDDDERLLSTIAANTGVALQNARLFEEAGKRAQELGVLNDLGRVVAGELDQTKILQALAERIRQLIPLNAFTVALYRPATDTFVLPIVYRDGAYLPEEEGPAQKYQHSQTVLQSRRSQLVLRTAAEVAAAKAQRLPTQPAPAGSLMFAPLIVGAQNLGALSVHSYALNAYTPEQLALLEGAAGQTAIALENARLFSEAQRRAEQLATAAEVSQTSISVLNPDELMVQVVELIRERFGLYYAALFLIDEGGQWAVLRHATGEAGRTLLERKHRLEVGGSSMVGWTTSNRKARIALDVGAEAVRFVNPLLPATRSEMALPLVVGEQVLGALDVQSTQANAFSEADIAILQSMADQIAIAIRNAQLITTTQRTEHFLDSVIENLPITLSVKTTADSRYIRWNKAVEDLTGVARAEALGNTDTQLFVPEDVRRFAAQDRAVVASQRPMDVSEETWQTRSKGTRIVHSRRIPLLNDAGEVEYVLNLADDITERKQAEAALDYERYLLRTMLDNVPDKIYFKDDQSRFIRVSRAVAEQFGLNPDQVVGKTDYDFFTKSHAKQAFEDEQKMLESGDQVLGKLERETWPDRPDTWVLTSKMILRDPAGRVMGSFGISRDVTDLKNAQDIAQRSAQQMAAAAEIAKAATSTLNIDELLRQSVGLIRDRFGFYQASIFIIEPGSNLAQIRASTGEAGREMLARRHHLAVGSKSLVGTATATKETVVVQDVANDPHHFKNPLLPDTRGEAVIPLVAGDTVIGAMDVQSTQPNVFGTDDLSILRTIADQLAVAVQNARLFERTARQARREKLVVDITSKLRASNDVDTMLRTAVTELRQALGVSHGAVRLDLQKRATGETSTPTNGHG